jgi:hypothetical protein
MSQPWRWSFREPQVEAAHTVVYGPEVNYVLPEHINARDTKAVVIKAPMGCGKTVALTSYINSLPSTARVIVITPRQSFARTTCDEFNRLCGGKVPFQCYLNLTQKGIKVRDCPRIFVQFESLHILRDANNVLEAFDVVVMDESESVLTQSVTIETNRERIVANQLVCTELLLKCKRCFLMDAFLSERSFRVVKSLGLSYTYHLYQKRPVERKALQYDTAVKCKPYKKAQQVRDCERFLGALMGDLQAGARIYAFFSSLRVLQRFEGSIREKLPLKKLLIYSSAVKTSLEDIRERWANVDLVMTTSTITVGCNFDVPDCFNKIYIYAGACAENLVRDMFQSHMRVRHLLDQQMNYLVNPIANGRQLFQTREQLIERESKKCTQLKLQYQQAGQQWYETAELWRELQIDSLEESNHSVRCIGEMFEYYLRECNYTSELPNPESLVEEALEDAEEVPRFEYSSVPRLTVKDLKTLLSQRTSHDPTVPKLTDLQKASIERYYFEGSTREDLTEEREAKLWDVYQKMGRERFNNARYEMGLTQQLTTLDELVGEKRGDMWNDGFQLRVVAVRRLCEKLGFRNTLEEQKISRGKFEACIAHPDFKRLKDEAYEAFKLTDRSEEGKQKEGGHVRAAQQSAKCILEAWDGTILKFDPTRRRVWMGEGANRKQVSVQGLILEPLDSGFARDVLGRNVREKERERLARWNDKHDEEVEFEQLGPVNVDGKEERIAGPEELL